MIVYNAHPYQSKFHKSKARIRGAFAGKRGGKTECCAIETIKHLEKRPGYNPNGIDPYLGVLVAPTFDMLRRLSLAKFMAYAKPFKPHLNKSNLEVEWHNGAKLYCVSADKPNRLEGLKANFIWVDEILQIKHDQLFLECLARTADTQGKIWVSGSLGTDYINPKNHWAYHYFKEKPLDDSETIEWSTADNPYFPKDELKRLKDMLDPATYRALFSINWDGTNKSAVYEISEDHLIRHEYNPTLPTYVTIDWGYASDMACLFVQHDTRQNKLIVFDEIVRSRMTLDDLWDGIKAKGYKINDWTCDSAGNQKRELSGISNVNWFKEKGISFKYRNTAITYGIPMIRSRLKNGLGQVKLQFDKHNATKTIDQLKQYSYPMKDGKITDEKPIKINDHCCDALRYLIVNKFDTNKPKDSIKSANRWGAKTWR